MTRRPAAAAPWLFGAPTPSRISGAPPLRLALPWQSDPSHSRRHESLLPRQCLSLPAGNHLIRLVTRPAEVQAAPGRRALSAETQARISASGSLAALTPHCGTVTERLLEISKRQKPSRDHPAGWAGRLRPQCGANSDAGPAPESASELAFCAAYGHAGCEQQSTESSPKFVVPGSALPLLCPPSNPSGISVSLPPPAPPPSPSFPRPPALPSPPARRAGRSVTRTLF